jgi:hypothetical protein
MAKKKLKIWLSATQLSVQDFGQIVSLLPNFDIIFNQNVISSSGTAFELDAHLEKLKSCNLFLGIINPKMSIPNTTEPNIPLKEIEKAIELGMPYWYVVHRDVTFTRNLLNDLFLKAGSIQSSKYVFDTRTIDIYKEVIQTSRKKPNHNELTSFFRLSNFLDQINAVFSQTNKNKKRQKLMLASTVYGFEDQLSKIISDLEPKDYTILNSFYGSIKVDPNLSNLANCIQSVHETDLFVGLIRPFYGTGNIRDKEAKNPEDKNITFEEIRKAIELEKPRWFYVHRDVDFGYKIVDYIDVNVTEDEKKSGNIVNKNVLKANVLVDMSTIDLYNYVIQNHINNVAKRNGNWVQEFLIPAEALRYIQTQFQDNTFIKSLIQQRNHE